MPRLIYVFDVEEEKRIQRIHKRNRANEISMIADGKLFFQKTLALYDLFGVDIQIVTDFDRASILENGVHTYVFDSDTYSCINGYQKAHYLIIMKKIIRKMYMLEGFIFCKQNETFPKAIESEEMFYSSFQLTPDVSSAIEKKVYSIFIDPIPYYLDKNDYFMYRFEQEK